VKNAVFWGVSPCGSCKNSSLGGTCGLHHEVDQRARNVSCHPDMRATHSTETSVLTRSTWRLVSEDGFLQYLKPFFPFLSRI
jgi:hypothetical protein